MEAVYSDHITVSEYNWNVSLGYNTADIYFSSINRSSSSKPNRYFVGYIYLPSSNPIGYLDSYSGGEGIINISGWASDADEPDTGIEIHVYIGGSAGSPDAEGHSGIYANLYRSDVGNHAYSATIHTNKTGEQSIYVYAINVGGGNNVLINSGTVTITANEKPTISNVRVENLSSEGYTVRCDVSDNSGIASVKFPTWTVANGQDDLKWYEGTVSGNSAECTINVSNHNNETNCFYNTHIYVNDTSGNVAVANIDEIYVDSTAPVISNVKVENVSTSGFDITCQVYDDQGVMMVKFPTWTKDNGQDDLMKDWTTNDACNGKIDGNKVSYHVNTSDHNYEKGIYFVHIYAFDECRNRKNFTMEVYVGEKNNMTEPLSVEVYDGHTYMLFEGENCDGNSMMDWTEAAAYCQSIGGVLTCISDEDENNIVKSMVSSYGSPCWIGGNDLASEGSFVWESGEPFSYTNWDSGEPNNKEDQDYIRMYPNGLWDDSESAGYAFICEFGEPELLISDCTITLSDTSYVYDETDKIPVVTVKYKENVLSEDTDYTVACYDNVEAGTAKVVITGKGSYSGSVLKTFNIAKAEQTITLNNSCLYIGEGKKEQIIAHGKGTLSYFTDSEIIEVSDTGLVTGKTIGTAIVKVTAEGDSNYFAASTDVTVVVEHVYGEATITKEATCTEEGEKAVFCKVCGVLKEGSRETIPAADHQWKTEYTVDKQPTDTSEGQKSIHCNVCGTIKEGSIQMIPVIDHTVFEITDIAVTSYNKLTLRWPQYDGAGGYLIYKVDVEGNDGILKNITDGSVTSYIHTVTSGVRNTYKIAAYQLDGTNKVVLAESPVKSGTALPAAPNLQNIDMKAYNKIGISWTKVNGCEGYVVYRSTSETGKFSVVKTITQATATSYTNMVTDDTMYFYKVRAFVTVDGAKVYGGYSRILSGNVISGPPENFRLEQKTSTKVVLSWDKVEDCDGYVIYLYTPETGKYKAIKNVTDKDTPTYAHKIIEGTSYTYVMRAFRTVNGSKVYSDYGARISNM